MHKCLACIIALLAFGLFTEIAAASTIRLQQKHTRAQIEKACQRVAGTSFGTKLNRGEYGCNRPGGQVNCTADGTCFGSCGHCGERVIVVQGPGTVSGVLNNSATAGR